MLRLQLSKIAGVGFLILLTPLLVNSLLPQLTTTLFGKASSFSNLIIISLIIFSAVFAYVCKSLILKPNIFLSSFIYFVYTFSLISYYSNENGFEYTLSGYFASILIYLLIIMSFISNILSHRMVLRFLLCISIVTSSIGILQYIFNAPLVNIGDSTGNFKISSYMFIETSPPRVRGFSLFPSGLDFGYLLLFCFGTFLYQILNKKFFYLIPILFISAAIFATLTRNIYFGATLCFLGIFLYVNRKIKSKVLYVIPIISFLLALLVSSFEMDSSGLASNSSLEIRREFWQEAIKSQMRDNTLNFFIGRGIYQSGDANTGKLFVDNTYLHFIAQFGVLGLAAFLYVYFSLLNMAIKYRHSSVMAGLYGFLVAWPFLALFNICITPVVLYGALAILTDAHETGEE
ncbi:hypothetical protein SAMN04488058_11071 [Deinococcus reticulitermitis]|uniref:O-antigen ligase-related domain-containing protein n=2 Tax=Deinococcus reticulitermitis TaxID=856736 RepID=A0A1H6ZYL5_9DEIO|nr:hypothetical protein SAMN04488058_11071 [Deinococcus reticulitermitis]